MGLNVKPWKPVDRRQFQLLKNEQLKESKLNKMHKEAKTSNKK